MSACAHYDTLGGVSRGQIALGLATEGGWTETGRCYSLPVPHKVARLARLVLVYRDCAASFSRAFVTSRWKMNSLSAFSDRSVKFQDLPPFCFTFSSFFR